MTDTNVITISLDDVLGPDGLEGAWEAMVNRLADNVEGKFSHFESGKSFHKVCVDTIDSVVSDRVAKKIEEKLALPIQKTDSWGNPVGEPTTFDALLGEAVKNAFETHVDLYGKRISSSAASMFSKTVIEHALQRIALEGIEKHVYDAVKNVREEAKKSIAAEVAKAVKSAIK